MVSDLAEKIRGLLPKDGSTLGNTYLIRSLAVQPEDYLKARAELEDAGLIVRGVGRGGTVRLAKPVAEPVEPKTPGGVKEERSLYDPLKRWFDKPAFADEGLVIVSSPFFPHKLTRGYDNPMLQVVKTINGVPIKNLNHLVEVLRDSKDEFIRIEFDMRGAETLVFPRAELVAATDEILTDNGVRSQGSADTLAIWNGKGGTGRSAGR